MANCSGVQPGGKEAFECLVRNDAKLSPSCQAAVNAAAPKPSEPAAATAPAAPATATPAQSETVPPAAKVERAPPGIQVAPAEAQNEELKTVQQACTLNDFASHCSWIAPNNPEILQCLKANAADLSPNCQAAVQSLPAPPPPPAEPARQAAPAKKSVEPKPAEPARPGAPPAPAPAAPAGSAAPRANPTAQRTAAIRAACRSDFMSHCSGVQPGGAEALQCLKRNEAQLSAACRSAVAAIGGGGGAALSGAPAAAAAPAVAPIGPMPMLRPREALAIVQICGVEVRSLCAGIPFGGGRIISCLAANASSLSPSCYGALSAAAGR
jgi:hypothetical protein